VSQDQSADAVRPFVEIKLSEEEAEVAKRLLSLLINGQNSTTTGPALGLHQFASGVQSARKDRRKFFPQQLFAEPAWDIMLSLYAAKAERQRFTVTDVANAVDLPLTSALRTIGALGDAGMIERVPDPHDRRRVIVELTDMAENSISQWLSHVIVKLGALVAGQSATSS
jgi:DNA-binding MarR family transcriptional regulator